MQLLNAAATKCDNLYIRWLSKGNGHIGQANTLAKEASTLMTGTVPDAPLPTKITISTLLTSGTDTQWVNLFHLLRYPEECRQTKQWWPTVDKKRSQQMLALKRRQWGIMVQFMTGHNHMGRHNNIVDANEDPECKLCNHGYPQTTAHIIGECLNPHLTQIRVNLFGRRQISPPFNNLAIGKVLAFQLQSGITALDWW